MNFSKSFKKPYLGFKTPAVMGILNITPDSFSDGGKYFSKQVIAINNAIKMHKMGADIIDIGAESTRPGALPVKPEIEIKRLKPIILGLKNKRLNISIDTRNSLTMKFALENGIKIINDVSALNHDPESINVVKASKCLLVLMHMQGNPQTMQKEPKYNFAPRDIYYFFNLKIRQLMSLSMKILFVISIFTVRVISYIHNPF